MESRDGININTMHVQGQQDFESQVKILKPFGFWGVFLFLLLKISKKQKQLRRIWKRLTYSEKEVFYTFVPKMPKNRAFRKSDILTFINNRAIFNFGF